MNVHPLIGYMDFTMNVSKFLEMMSDISLMILFLRLVLQLILLLSPVKLYFR